MRKMAMAVLAATLTMSACGTTTAIRDPDAGSGNTVSVKAHEYGFDVAGTAKTGPLSLEIANTGKEIHHAILGRIDEGKTLEDVKAAAASTDEEPPAWFHDDPFDSGLLSPGAKQTLTFPITEAGTYVLLCFLPAKDGKPHVEKGMAATFTVAEGPSDAEAPKADATVSMTEYAFTAPEVRAGASAIAVKNDGKENHDVVFAKFAEGKSFADVGLWFQGGAQGPAPAEFLGGSHTIPPGSAITFTVPLDAGTYSLVCTEQTDDGKQHVQLGMVTQFTVK